MTKKFNLHAVIIENSESKVFLEAREEWDITNAYQSSDLSGYCICGKEHIALQYEIRNRLNDNIIHPIGSKCIGNFGLSRLKTITKTVESGRDIFKEPGEHFGDPISVVYNDKTFMSKVISGKKQFKDIRRRNKLKKYAKTMDELTHPKMTWDVLWNSHIECQIKKYQIKTTPSSEYKMTPRPKIVHQFF